MIVIGVDGGGTKTAMAAYKDGVQIAQSRSGPMNYNFIGVDAAAENFIAGFRALELPADEITAIGIGDPSLDDGVTEDSESSAAKFFRKLQEELGIPVFARSDAYITLFGLTGGKEPAVLMLSGTGAMGIAENAAHETKVAGGWGRLLEDEGSGYYIAVEALRSACHAFEGIGPETALCDAILKHFGFTDHRDMILSFYGEEDPNLASFAKTVCDCAEAGDAVACTILQNAAKFLVAFTSTLIEWSGSRKVGVYGSVICSSRIVREQFEAQLYQKYPDLTISEPPVSAEQAAAMYAERMLGESGK